MSDFEDNLMGLIEDAVLELQQIRALLTPASETPEEFLKRSEAQGAVPSKPKP